MNNREFTPERITELKENEIFVFGSNLAGSHGGGAAHLAYERFGAIWGKGVGIQGQCYAIPTMHGGVEAIKPYVDDFIVFAKSHPNLKFLVTRIGCGIAGFKDEEIAPLFQDALEVENVILPKEFVMHLNNPIREWFHSFKKLLHSLSEKFQKDERITDNDTYASIGATPESQKLIKELCDEIDEEYRYRKELASETDPETKFEAKIKETLDELADEGIIERPKDEDYEKVLSAIEKATTRGLVAEAEKVVEELNTDSDVLAQNELNDFNKNEED